jgi:hypothetical protein
MEAIEPPSSVESTRDQFVAPVSSGAAPAGPDCQGDPVEFFRREWILV